MMAILSWLSCMTLGSRIFLGNWDIPSQSAGNVSLQGLGTSHHPDGNRAPTRGAPTKISVPAGAIGGDL